MGSQSKIEWCHATFNPWRGCAHVHAGCANCYAETMSKRNPGTLGVWGPNGTRVVASESMWMQPLKWNLEAGKAKAAWSASHRGKMACDEPPPERPRVFCASLADVFEDWDGTMLDAKGIVASVDESSGAMLASHKDAKRVRNATMDDVRRRLFGLIDATPNLDWLLVTKRPENVRRMWPAKIERQAEFGEATHKEEYRPNVWLLTSVSDQATADAMIPNLLGCRDLVPVLGLSAEPLLGGLDLRNHFGWFQCQKCLMKCYAWDGRSRCCDGEAKRFIDWVIVGGESGHGRRKMESEWAQNIVDQCRNAGVKCFMKQMEIGGKITGEIELFPSSLRVREYPDCV